MQAMLPIRSLLILFILALINPSWLPAAPEQRIALVIGNGAYSSGPLKNPINDATDMATMLKKLGFSVTHKQNINQQEMDESIREFGRQLKRTRGVGLFFYAGHGIQIGGVNYLLPVNARIEKESDVRFQAVNAEMVLAEMENAENRLNVVILDACRDNPFSRSFRNATRGLAIVSNAPSGTFISYSTGANQVARDGEGRNSPYTKALLENISKPGLTISDVFMNVRTKVKKETGQIPWELSSLEVRFYFTHQGSTENNRSDVSSDMPQPKADELARQKAAIEREKQEIARERQELERQKALDAEREQLADERRKLEAEKQQLAMAKRPSQSTIADKKNKPVKVDNYIAVFDFEFKTGDKDLSRSLAESVRREIVLSGKYKVIDRGNMEKILGELKLEMSGAVAQMSVVEAGQILGVGKIVSGSVGIVEKTYYLTLQLIDVKTGKVELSAEDKCKCEIDELLGSTRRLAKKLLGEKVDEPVAIAQKPATVAIVPPAATVKETAKDGRFIAYSNGTVLDTQTNLMWAAKDNGSSINWANAKSYCENYRGGGYTDWRMPTLNELAGLSDKNKSYRATQRNYNVYLTDFIQLSACCPWASETRGSKATHFHFLESVQDWSPLSDTYDNRVLPVRSAK